MRLSRAVVRDVVRHQRLTLAFALERARSEDRFCRLQKTLADQNIRHNLFPGLGLLFVHTPRTAGTSVHRALSRLEDRVIGSARKPERPPLAVHLHKHATASEWRDALGEDAWRHTYSFNFVRNPWDLMVSCYFWWLQKAPTFPWMVADSLRVREMGSFDRFMDSHYGRSCINEWPGTMSDWFQSDRRDLVRYVGKVETLERDLSMVLAEAGVVPDGAGCGIDREHSSDRQDYRRYYSDSSKKIVARRFADVIDRFGYTY